MTPYLMQDPYILYLVLSPSQDQFSRASKGDEMRVVPFDRSIVFKGVHSEAGIRTVMGCYVFNRVSFFLEWATGLPLLMWKQEAKAVPSSSGGLLCKTDRERQPDGDGGSYDRFTLVVKGKMYKRPDFELFDADGRIRSFQEAILP